MNFKVMFAYNNYKKNVEKRNVLENLIYVDMEASEPK